MTSTTKKTAASAPPAQNIITPDSLVPTGDATAVTPAVYWWWVGLTPRAPEELGHWNITLGGVSFAWRTEAVKPASAHTQRIPLIGSVVRLGVDQVRAVAAAARRKFFRPLHASDTRRGKRDYAAMVLTQPGELEIARANGRPVLDVRFQDGDISAAEVAFMQWMPTGSERVVRPGDRPIPPPIAQVGIALPPEDAEPASSDMTKGLDLSFCFAV